MKYKNYYKILGLDGNKATLEDIKSSYRKLAKKYHPDINPGDEIAAEKFKDINEAYQTLTSEEARRRFDRIHFAYKIKDGLNFKNAFNKESGFNEFVETFVGKSQKIDKKVKNATRGEDIESEIEITLEEAFTSSEKKIVFKYADEKTKSVTVKIPQGIKNNGKIKIPGQGKPSQDGGENGDLYIKVKLIPSEKFKIDGKNLVMDLPITPWEAVLGCDIDVKAINEDVTLILPAGTQSGCIIKLKNHGYYDQNGERGDLIANVKIMVPDKITKEEAQLYTKLKNISQFLPRND